MLLDVKSAYDFLKEKGKEVSIIGSSIGSNLALIFAASHQDVNKIVLLSPGLDYKGLKTEDAIAVYRGKVLIVASEEDSYSAESSRKLYKMSELEEGQKKLEIFDRAGHGTTMLASRPQLVEEILEWVK